MAASVFAANSHVSSTGLFVEVSAFVPATCLLSGNASVYPALTEEQPAAATAPLGRDLGIVMTTMRRAIGIDFRKSF